MPDLTNMLSIALLGMAQAVDLRGRKNCSPFLQKNYDLIRAEVTKLTHDRRMDIDIKVINKMLRDGLFR